MRVFAPLPDDHPLVAEGIHCALCRQAFKKGEITTLIQGVPADAQEARRREQGRPYETKATAAHAECYAQEIAEIKRIGAVAGISPIALDLFIAQHPSMTPDEMREVIAEVNKLKPELRNRNAN